MKLLTAAELAELIQAGDALMAEAQIDADSFEESGDFTQADIMRDLVSRWQSATAKHRER